MQVAYFVNSFPKVSETFIMNQIEAVLSSGHELTIFAANHPEEGVTHQKIDEHNMVEFCTYTNPPESYISGARKAAQTLIKNPQFASEVLYAILSDRRARRIANLKTYLSHGRQTFDAYHAHFGPVGEDWSFLHRLSHANTEEAQFIVSFYGYDASKIIDSESNPYQNVFAHSDIITVLSEDMEQSLVKAGCPEEKITYNPLGIDTNFFYFKERQPPDDEINLLIVSRLVEKKGIKFAIDALAHLDDLDITLTIVGDGPRREDLERRIEQQGIGDRVDMVGLVPLEEVREYLYDAHLFLMPCITDSEGNTSPTPTILLQAQATGMPIVATQHAGIPRIVKEGKSALLVPERDVKATSNAIRKLAENPERWGEMGRYGREFVESKHSINALSNRLTELYEG